MKLAGAKNGVSTSISNKSPPPNHLGKMYRIGCLYRMPTHMAMHKNRIPVNTILPPMRRATITTPSRSTPIVVVQIPSMTSHMRLMRRLRKSSLASTPAGITGSRYIQFDIMDSIYRMEHVAGNQSFTVSRNDLSWSISQTLYTPSPSKSTTAVAVARNPSSDASTISMR